MAVAAKYSTAISRRQAGGIAISSRKNVTENLSDNPSSAPDSRPKGFLSALQYDRVKIWVASALGELHIENPTPPEVKDDAFSTYAYVTLYVPVGSKDAYMQHDIWGKFGNIVEE